MRDRSRIRALAASGFGVSAIAREVGCSRGAVYRALEPGAALSYRRRSRFEGEMVRVREVLAAYPLMPATTLAYVVGWPGSVRRLQQLVHPMRSELVRAARESGVVVRPVLGMGPESRGVAHG